MSDISRPSSQRKHEAILAAAEQIFLRDGFRGANMDELATLSQVSKQTVYKHFGSKEALFVDLVTSMTRGAGDGVHEEMPLPRSAGGVGGFLEEFGRRQLGVVLDARILQLRRLVIGEVGRFPDLGQALWRAGPMRSMTALTTAFSDFIEKGWMRDTDPRTAASFFNWLVMSPINEAMLLGDDVPRDPESIRRHCAEATRVFLAAYGRGAAIPA
ncbi:TetR/AcrR family transcriptional regulator [Herbiconiux sp. CPCC 205763]|uniref:TetR/AcrR family transcriptional regulator n=1 Tax=Herbiconiux aconitum TaxID=2970913 RepID=A0ABT2GQP1_9MICO|nr:TetR/AcrR family transcriptional regulator [Herbiconiux aconitum]MCS5718529.1 TetR/AcrR family transcriptional regulator [Herbiconiux aconitum]